MNVGILGSGDVAQALGRGFLKHGYSVMMGMRDTRRLSEWSRPGPNASVGRFADAARFGELIVLAVKGTAAAEALRAAGVNNFAGKTIIDATNPLADDPPVYGVHKYFTNLDDSLMERLQREFPNARFVKAFNQVNNSRMVNPQFAGTRPTMFICGNHAKAKESVTRILDQFGWEAEDMGHVEAARAIEPLCLLWAIRYHLHKKWDHAFKLLKDPE
jgi:8-hydroxy-5-deazaflavin:NADPH oxidoreductase